MVRILTDEGRERLARKKIFIKRIFKGIKSWCKEHPLQTAFALMCWAITPLMFIAADIERGYDALGGEAAIPILPFLVWLISEGLKKDE